MNRGSFNVIVVDWGAGAKTLNYIAARNRVSNVGTVVAQFIDFLATSCGVVISIVGHGLGAHVAGMAGKQTTSGQVHTIFGLDPARPLFYVERPTERLAAQDAQYVESIVTSGGVLAMFEPSGISTFYPNGGARQPGN
jgi:pancreatic triacylglycerol lipase